MSLLPDFIEHNDQTRAREEHLNELRALVGNVYPNKFERSHIAGDEDTITALVQKFADRVPKLSEGERPAPEALERINAELKQAGTVRTSGRIATPPRVMGKAAFVHLSDGQERLQIYVRKAEAQAISNDTGQPVDDFDSGWKVLQLLDHGDFIGVEGNLFVTKTGELSIHVQKIQFLSKALLPMPDKMHGLTDPEIRQRQRYVDLIASSLKVEKPDEGEKAEKADEGNTASRELSSREVFVRRSRLIREMRRYLDDHGYIEVETPMLSPKATGAAAKPFETYHNALDIPLYARIAPELYLKRLLVGGFERVYELNRNFRNEGISTRHNPEFTMLEFYTAYKDVNWMMDFCEEMLRETVKKVMKSLVTPYTFNIIFTTGNFFEPDSNFTIHSQEFTFDIDFSQRFNRLSMSDAIKNYLPDEYKVIKFGDRGFDERWLEDSKLTYLLSRLVDKIRTVHTPPPTVLATPESRLTLEQLINKFWPQVLEEEKLRSISSYNKIDTADNAGNIQNLFEKIAENSLNRPTFITDFPKPISPLSKASPSDPTVAERFELYVAGMEVANGFSELNDPVEQYERFRDQVEQRERGDEEAMVMDEDYIRALAYGMPPAAGIGIGIDRLAMLLTNRQSIRDVILFPHMRPQRKAEEKTDDGQDEDKQE